jgi:hypothetical protein
MTDLSTLSDAELLQLHQQALQAPPMQAPPIAPEGQSPGGPLRLTVTRPGASKPVSEMTDAELLAAHRVASAQGVGYAEDVARTIPSGLVRGVTSMLGAPADLTNLAFRGMEYLDQKIRGETDEQYARRITERKASAPFDASKLLEPFTGRTIKGAVEENLTGPLYEPQTTPGKYVNTAAEFVPGALLGPGGMARKAISYGVLPGVASEAAGQVTQGSAAEPWARGGAALLAGGGAAVWNRPNSAGRTLQEATQGVTDAQMNAAEQLFQHAQQMGSPITRAEALQQVTGGATRLGDVQRVVEGSGQMRPFFAERAGRNETAAREAFNALEPNPTNAPSSIGPAVGRSAEDTIEGVRGAINRRTEPLYRDLEQRYLTPQDWAVVSADPVFQEGLRRVRTDPWIGPQVAHLPDNNARVIDAVKKQLDETGRNLRDPMSGTARNNYAASIVEQGNRPAVAAADTATGSTATQAGSYETARAIQEDLRRRYLEPLKQGPLGKLADKDLATRQAMEALFPRNPLPNSADEISTALSAVNQRNPWAARQLLRTQAESVFIQAARELQSGPNQWGGAGFAAALRGNSQQAENLAAAVRAVHGDAAWNGFERFLQVMEAQGTRQRIGSQTSFNTEMLGELRRGNAVGESVLQASTVGLNLPRKVKDTVERWRLGRNVDELANLLTNPEAGTRFRQLAQAPRGSSQAAALTSRLVYMATQPARTQPSSQSRAQ